MHSFKLKYTKLCFAIVLSFSLLLSAVRFAPAAEAAKDKNSDGQSYTYSVEITFGALSFVYDWGTWDTTELRYKASDASEGPAAGTVDRFPGWYGFDGAANLVTVKYNKTSEEAGHSSLNVSLEYNISTDLSGVKMDFYTNKTLTADPETNQPANGKIPNIYSFSVPAIAPDDTTSTATQIWLSLSGAPMQNGSQFHSQTLTAIGTLTFKLGTFNN